MAAEVGFEVLDGSQGQQQPLEALRQDGGNGCGRCPGSRSITATTTMNGQDHLLEEPSHRICTLHTSVAKGSN
ncbi:hypothetical protein EJ110_NYTH15083 [Nymphaea thermarum]|nr:hypothetical protein EJ110_NYTH15083 [Nymphaea thermarum]